MKRVIGGQGAEQPLSRLDREARPERDTSRPRHHRAYTCSICGEQGHSRPKCPKRMVPVRSPIPAQAPPPKPAISITTGVTAANPSTPDAEKKPSDWDRASDILERLRIACEGVRVARQRLDQACREYLDKVRS